MIPLHHATPIAIIWHSACSQHRNPCFTPCHTEGGQRRDSRCGERGLSKGRRRTKQGDFQPEEESTMLCHRRRGREGTLVPQSLTLGEKSALFFMWGKRLGAFGGRTAPGDCWSRTKKSVFLHKAFHHSTSQRTIPMPPVFVLVHRGHVLIRNSIISPQMSHLLSTVWHC